MMKSDPLPEGVVYANLSYQIMGVVYDVHNLLGPGFSEEMYEQALCYEFEEKKIPYERQKVIQVCYKDRPVGIYRLDLVVAGKVIVELKAVTMMQEVFRYQLLSYLKATGLELGLLINFGQVRAEYIRVVNSKNPPPPADRRRSPRVIGQS